MRYALFFLLTSLLTATASYAQPLSEEHRAIAPYLDSETVLVGWIDISQLNLDDMAGFLADIDTSPPPPAELARIKAIQDALVRLHVKRVYWISDLISVASGPEQWVVPSANPEAVSVLIESMTHGDIGSERDGDNVLVGKADAMTSLKTKKGEPPPELLAAIASCAAPHGLAFATPTYVTMSAMEILKSLTQGDDLAQLAAAAEALASIKWIALSASLPPQKLLLRVETKGTMAAEKLSKLVNELTSNRLSDRADLLSVHAENSMVTLTSNSNQDSAAKLLAFRDLFLLPNSTNVTNSMKQIALALHNYHDAHQHLPPQSLVDADGRRLLSWRVLILPYLDQQALYQQFHLDEAWDSPHNLELAETIIPFPYATRQIQQDGPLKTCIVAPMTKDSVFGRPGKPVQLRDVTDGLSNTLWIVEAAQEHAVVWTKPEDLPIDERAPMQSILGAEGKGFFSSMADGSAHYFPRELDDKTLNALITINGGEAVNPQ